MPQHWAEPSRVSHWRALVAIVALALAAGQAQVEIGYAQPGGTGAAPADAARQELSRSLRLDLQTVESTFGGSDEWQTGTLAIPADEEGYEEPRVYLYVAKLEAGRWTAAIEGTDAFDELAGTALADLSGTASADLLATTVSTSSGNGSAQLSLPWAKGQTWRLTGGPHNFNGGKSRPWSSLDFAGPEPGVSVKVRAARGGIVVRPCRNLVQVRHGDGWTTSYYHLKNIAVKAGQSVKRGQVLGYTSNASGCGGSSTGPHVHFSLLKSGSYVNIRGHTIGGWTVKEGSKPYEGCMVKNGVRRCAPNGRIYNDGMVGTSTTTTTSTAALLAD
jgi:LasA protease